VALNTPKLGKAVEDFKKLCDPHTELYQYGQFYVTNRTIDLLRAQVEADLKANIRFQLVPDQPPPLLNFFKAKLDVDIDKIDVPRIMAMLDAIEIGGDMAGIRDMFKPSKADRANAQSDFDTLWSSKDMPSAPRWTGTASLPKARAAYDIEKSRCGYVLRDFARMLLRKRAIGPLPAAAQLWTRLLAGASVSPITPQRQELIYRSAAELNTAVTNMKAVIDAGGYVHCGVLSGARHEHSKFPSTPEHHILAFAYDTFEGQTAFLFWDPDCAHSNIAALPWGRGFGLLFSRAGRLCTGVDDADLAGLDLDPHSDFFGNHNTRDPLRHCYQVYTLQSLPLKATVKLHTKVMSTPAGASVDDMLDNAVWLYAAHGIELHEASREVIDPGSDLDRYQTLFTGDGDTGPSDELTALHAALRARREEFGVEPPPDEAVVAFVGQLVPAARGSALSPPDQPGIVLSAASAGDWTLAHEMGRLAGLEVAPVPGRLMSASTAGLNDPELTETEAQEVLQSPLAEA
jgi:hypothetical protein